MKNIFIEIVDGDSQDEVEKQLIKFKESVKIVNTFHPASKFTTFRAKIQLNRTD